MSPATSLPPQLAFIGGGNMARSLIGGLVARGVRRDAIRVAEPVPALREALSADFGVQVCDDAAAAAAGIGFWLLAVKPQVMPAVARALAAQAEAARPVVVSIAAGITSTQLHDWLGGHATVVRAMPNTPALLGEGVTGLYARPGTSEAQRDAAQAVLACCGATAWVGDERLMDAVTAVSGSGPAYVFLLAEAMRDAARVQGLDEEIAAVLVTQTIAGAAAMLRQGEAPATLRARVTSPGGTTQAAVETLQAGGFEALVNDAIAAATRRGAELAAGHG